MPARGAALRCSPIFFTSMFIWYATTPTSAFGPVSTTRWAPGPAEVRIRKLLAISMSACRTGPPRKSMLTPLLRLIRPDAVAASRSASSRRNPVDLLTTRPSSESTTAWLTSATRSTSPVSNWSSWVWVAGMGRVMAVVLRRRSSAVGGRSRGDGSSRGGEVGVRVLGSGHVLGVVRRPGVRARAGVDRGVGIGTRLGVGVLVACPQRAALETGERGRGLLRGELLGVAVVFTARGLLPQLGGQAALRDAAGQRGGSLAPGGGCRAGALRGVGTGLPYGRRGVGLRVRSLAGGLVRGHTAALVGGGRCLPYDDLVREQHDRRRPAVRGRAQRDRDAVPGGQPGDHEHAEPEVVGQGGHVELRLLGELGVEGGVVLLRHAEAAVLDLDGQA